MPALTTPCADAILDRLARGVCDVVGGCETGPVKAGGGGTAGDRGATFGVPGEGGSHDWAEDLGCGEGCEEEEGGGGGG